MSSVLWIIFNNEGYNNTSNDFSNHSRLFESSKISPKTFEITSKMSRLVKKR
jgi:hypothetical protein